MSIIARGLAAGAAGTAALELTSYVDMLVRDRESSSVPGKVVDAIAARLGIERVDENRRSAFGALLGYANGLGVGVGYAFAREIIGDAVPPWLAGIAIGAASMAASDLTSTRLGVTDPSSWSTADWLSDVIPHLAYGWVVASTCEGLHAND